MRNNFKDLTVEELVQKKKDLKDELFTIKMDKVVGHVDNPLKARTLRRAIARINTLLNQKKSEVETAQES